MFSKPPHIVVVGAGIIGASLTYHLVRKKARVTLIDKSPQLATGSTETSFAWLTVGHNVPETYRLLRQQAIVDWHRVQEELKGQLNVDWSGALTWRDDPAETERVAHELINSSDQVRLVDQREIRLLEPNLKIVPSQAVFAKNEGAVDPTLTTALFLTDARQNGASIQLGNEVLSLMTNGSRITGVVTTNGKIVADVVVLTAGINTTTLCQPLGVTLPLHTSPAILMAFHVSRRFVNRIVSNSHIELRAASTTLTLAADDYVDESAENSPQAIARRTLERIKENWQGAERIKLANVMVGQRPIPQDGLPIIGRIAPIEGLYVAVMHAGVTLAALIGRLAAGEIANDHLDRLLSLYRPTRFQ